jgi:hypothetical protein
VTRDEYLAVLDSEPATLAQRGAVMGECDRLGLADRGERLAILAVLLGLDALGSTRDLTMGQAGKIVRALRLARDRAELPSIIERAGGGQGGGANADPGEFISLADAIDRILLLLLLAVHGKDLQAKSGHMPPNIRRLCASRVFTPASADHSERMREKDDSQ